MFPKYIYNKKMKRKLTDEQRIIHQKASRIRYRQTDKGRLAYYHKTKQLKKKKVKHVENRGIIEEN